MNTFWGSDITGGSQKPMILGNWQGPIAPPSFSTAKLNSPLSIDHSPFVLQALSIFLGKEPPQELLTSFQALVNGTRLEGSVREGFAVLTDVQKETLKEAVPPKVLQDLLQVATSERAEDVASVVVRSGRDLESMGKLSHAYAFYHLVADPKYLSNLPANHYQRSQAQKLGGALSEEGPFDFYKLEHYFGQTFRELTDLPHLALFPAAGATYRGTRAVIGLPLVRSLPFVRGFTSRMVAAIPGVAAEAGVFSGGGTLLADLRGQEHFLPFGKSWWDTAKFLGAMRFFTGMGTSLFDRVHGVNPYTLGAARYLDYASFSRTAIGQGSALMGVAAGSLAVDGHSDPFRVLLTHAKFSVLGRSGEALFGKPFRLKNLQWEMEARIHDVGPSLKGLPSFSFPNWGPQFAFATSTGTAFRPSPWGEGKNRARDLFAMSTGGGGDPFKQPKWGEVKAVPRPEDPSFFYGNVLFLDAHLRYFFGRLGIRAQDVRETNHVLAALSRVQHGFAYLGGDFNHWIVKLNGIAKKAKLSSAERMKLGELLQRDVDHVVRLLTLIGEEGSVSKALGRFELADEGSVVAPFDVSRRPQFSSFSDAVVPERLSQIDPAYENPFKIRRELISIFREMDAALEALERAGADDMQSQTGALRDFGRGVDRLFELYPHVARLYLRRGNRESIIDDDLSRRIDHFNSQRGDRQELIIETLDQRVAGLDGKGRKDFVVGKILFPLTQYNNTDPSHALGSAVIQFTRDYFRDSFTRELLADAEANMDSTSGRYHARQDHLLSRGGLGMVTPDGRVALFLIMDYVGQGPRGNFDETQAMTTKVAREYGPALLAHLQKQGWTFEHREGSDFVTVDVASAPLENLRGYRVRHRGAHYDDPMEGVVRDDLYLLPPLRLEEVTESRVKTDRASAHFKIHKEVTAAVEYIEKADHHGVHVEPLSEAQMLPYMGKLIPPARNLTPFDLVAGLANFERQPDHVNVLLQGLQALSDQGQPVVRNLLATALRLLAGDIRAVNSVYDALMDAPPTAPAVRLQTKLGFFGRPLHDLGRVMGRSPDAAFPRLKGWFQLAETGSPVHPNPEISTNLRLAFKDAHRILRIVNWSYENPRLPGIVDDAYFDMALKDYFDHETKPGDTFDYFGIDINDMGAYFAAHDVPGVVDRPGFRIVNALRQALEDVGYRHSYLKLTDDKYYRRVVVQEGIVVKEGDELFIVMPRRLTKGRSALREADPEALPKAVAHHMATQFGSLYFPDVSKTPEGRRYILMGSDGKAIFSKSPRRRGHRTQLTRVSAAVGYVPGLSAQEILGNHARIRGGILAAIDSPKHEVVGRRRQIWEAGYLVPVNDEENNKWGLKPVLIPKEQILPTKP